MGQLVCEGEEHVPPGLSRAYGEAPDKEDSSLRLLLDPKSDIERELLRIECDDASSERTSRCVRLEPLGRQRERLCASFRMD